MRRVVMRWVAAAALVVGLGAASVGAAGAAGAATSHTKQQVQQVQQTKSGQMRTADWWW